MDWKLLIIFIVLNVVNVVIQTVKSIATIKCGKWGAALVNALAYGLYTFVVIYMTIDGLSIWLKAGIIAVANLVGVYVVQVIEEKREKERLWKVEMAVPTNRIEWVKVKLSEAKIHNNYVTVGQYTMFNCYCYTKSETRTVRDIGKEVEAKYSAYESKVL